MRTDKWRYTEWVGFDYGKHGGIPDWGVVYGRELYDHSASPVPSDWGMEHVNVVDAPQHAGIVADFHRQLAKCGARPDACYLRP
jgi:hypothetical protein